MYSRHVIIGGGRGPNWIGSSVFKTKLRCDGFQTIRPGACKRRDKYRNPQGCKQTITNHFATTPGLRGQIVFWNQLRACALNSGVYESTDKPLANAYEHMHTRHGGKGGGPGNGA